MKIGVIGAGRLGICFALLVEQAGYNVLVSDIRQDYVDDLMEKKIKTNEPDVQELLDRSQNFEATTKQKVIQESDIVYTLVATPSLESGDYDVSAVWRVVDDIIESGVQGKHSSLDALPTLVTVKSFKRNLISRMGDFLQPRVYCSRIYHQRSADTLIWF